MYKLTGFVTDNFNWVTSSNGCPNMYGVGLHTLVFLCITILVLAKKEEYKNFRGLVNPGNMSIVNSLRIEAQNRGCNVDALIKEVQLDPYNREKAFEIANIIRSKCPGLSETGLQVLQNIPGWKNPSQSIWNY